MPAPFPSDGSNYVELLDVALKLLAGIFGGAVAATGFILSLQSRQKASAALLVEHEKRLEEIEAAQTAASIHMAKLPTRDDLDKSMESVRQQIQNSFNQMTQFLAIAKKD